MARVCRSATRRWEPGCSATGTVSGEGPAILDQVFRRSGYCVAATWSAFESRSRRTHSVIGRSFAWSMSRTTCRSRGSTYDGRAWQTGRRPFRRCCFELPCPLRGPSRGMKRRPCSDAMETPERTFPTRHKERCWRHAGSRPPSGGRERAGPRRLRCSAAWEAELCRQRDTARVMCKENIDLVLDRSARLGQERSMSGRSSGTRTLG
jgi:hypothetical protein